MGWPLSFRGRLWMRRPPTKTFPKARGHSLHEFERRPAVSAAIGAFGAEHGGLTAGFLLVDSDAVSVLLTDPMTETR